MSHDTLLAQFAAGLLTEAALSGKLVEAVEKADLDAALEHAAALTSGVGAGAGDGESSRPVFIAPTPRVIYDDAPRVAHASFVLALLPGTLVQPGSSLAKVLDAGPVDAAAGSDSDNNSDG